VSDLLPWYMPWSGRVLVLAVVLLGMAIMAFGRRGRRLVVPHCPRCGYCLTGAASPACPECGDVSSDGRRLRSRPRRWPIVLGLMVAMSLPVYVAQDRMRTFGWDYYLRLQPLYSVFGQPVIRR
jgi:hypothetical protein